jgi:hypothetical protein
MGGVFVPWHDVAWHGSLQRAKTQQKLDDRQRAWAERNSPTKVRQAADPAHHTHIAAASPPSAARGIPYIQDSTRGGNNGTTGTTGSGDGGRGGGGGGENQERTTAQLAPVGFAELGQE